MYTGQKLDYRGRLVEKLAFILLMKELDTIVGVNFHSP